MTERRRGWHALSMACTECLGPDPWCPICHGSGIYHNSHVVNDGLFDGLGCVGKVESFYDDGPWYANAMSPDGRHHRSGPVSSHLAAVEWCERVAQVSAAGMAMPTLNHGDPQP